MRRRSIVVVGSGLLVVVFLTRVVVVRHHSSRRLYRKEKQSIKRGEEGEEASSSSSSSCCCTSSDSCGEVGFLSRCFQTFWRCFGTKDTHAQLDVHGGVPSGGVRWNDDEGTSPSTPSVPLLLFYATKTDGKGAVGGGGSRRKSLLPFSPNMNHTSMSCASLRDGVDAPRHGVRALRRDGRNGTHYYFLVSMMTLGMGIEGKRRGGFTEKNSLLKGEDTSTTPTEDEGSPTFFDSAFPMYSVGTNTSSSGGGGHPAFWMTPIPTELLCRAMLHCYGGRDTKGYLFLQIAWNSAFCPSYAHEAGETSGENGRRPCLGFLPSPVSGTHEGERNDAASPSASLESSPPPPPSTRLLSFSLAFFSSPSTCFLSASTAASSASSSFVPPLPTLSSPTAASSHSPLASVQDGRHSEEDGGKRSGAEETEEARPPPPFSYRFLSLPLSLASCGQEQERLVEKSSKGGEAAGAILKSRVPATEEKGEEGEAKDSSPTPSPLVSTTASPLSPLPLSSSSPPPSTSFAPCSSLCAESGQEEVKGADWSYWALHLIRTAYWEERARWCSTHEDDAFVSSSSHRTRRASERLAWKLRHSHSAPPPTFSEDVVAKKAMKEGAQWRTPPPPPSSSSPSSGASPTTAADYLVQKAFVSDAIRFSPHRILQEAVQAVQRDDVSSVGELAFLLCLLQSPVGWASGLSSKAMRRTRRYDGADTRRPQKERTHRPPSVPSWDAHPKEEKGGATASPFSASVSLPLTRAQSFVLAPRLRYYIDEVLLPDVAGYLTRPARPLSEASTVAPSLREGGPKEASPRSTSPPTTTTTLFHPSSWWSRRKKEAGPPTAVPSPEDPHSLLPAASPLPFTPESAEKTYVLFLHLSLMQRGFLRLRATSATRYTDADKYHASLLKRLWMAGTKVYHQDVLPLTPFPPLAPPYAAISLVPPGGGGAAASSTLAFLSSITAFASFLPSVAADETEEEEEDEGSRKGKPKGGNMERPVGEGAGGEPLPSSAIESSNSGGGAVAAPSPPLVPAAKSSASLSAHPMWRALGFPSEDPSVLYHSTPPPPIPAAVTHHDILQDGRSRAPSTRRASSAALLPSTSTSSSVASTRVTAGKKCVGGVEGRGAGQCGVLGLLLLVDFAEKYPQEFATMILYNKQANSSSSSSSTSSVQSSAIGKKTPLPVFIPPPPPPYPLPVVSVLLLTHLLLPLADAVPTLPSSNGSPMPAHPPPSGMGSVDSSKAALPSAATVAWSPFGVPAGELPAIWSVAAFSLLYDRLWNCALYKTYQHAFHAFPPSDEEEREKGGSHAGRGDTAVGLPTVIPSSTPSLSPTSMTADPTSSTIVGRQSSPWQRFFGAGSTAVTKRKENTAMEAHRRRREEKEKSERYAAMEWDAFAQRMHAEMRWWKAWLPPSTSSASYLSTPSGRQPMHPASASSRLPGALSVTNRGNANPSAEKDTIKLPWSTFDAHQILQQSAMDGFYDLHHQLLRHFHVCWVQFHRHAAYGASSTATKSSTLSREKTPSHPSTSDSWRTSAGFVKPFIERVVIPTFFFPHAPLFFADREEK